MTGGSDGKPENRSFFFQAEDGIRDVAVTGVHTCALPISFTSIRRHRKSRRGFCGKRRSPQQPRKTRNFLGCCGDLRDRKSTRLNSSHGYISYAVFCLKKKKLTIY